MRRIVAVLLVFLSFYAVADVVHVYEKTLAGGVETQIADRTLDTGRSYFTQEAPQKNGYIFTHWTISTQQAFSARDDWGRAFDSAPFKLYEETTLTANYLPASLDADGDGIADGYELYWYGNLANGSSSDTDNDGKTFAEEIAAGSNPLFSERHEEGAVKYADGTLLLYNPFGYAPYTTRSEPERVCLAHIAQMKKALGISGVVTEEYAWRHIAEGEDDKGAQIDLVIDRSDGVVNLCEMKYSRGRYAISHDYAVRLVERAQTFADKVASGKSVFTTMVTPCGVQQDENSSVIQSEITAEDLFAD